ncbi:MAG: ACT domain-containing protein [Stomatobaculum sp.]
MEEEGKYYVVRRKAIPEVLLRVVETKKLLNADRRMTVKEATDRTGISRSSFYKYKEDIFPFSDGARGKMLTLSIEILDEPGLLSDLLAVAARFHANVMTIHQSIPVNGLASVSLSIEVLKETGNLSTMVEEMEALTGVKDVKILSRE